MKSKKLSLFLLALISWMFVAPIAKAADIPLLTWERGKDQNIVMGGNASDTWKIYLVGADKSEIQFRSSVSNTKGFVVYTITVPVDLAEGAYSVEARRAGEPTSVVAGVRIIERTTYTISTIPTDLRLLFILYAIFASAFAIIRGHKYSTLRFTRDKSHKILRGQDRTGARLPKFLQPFYNFRARRQAEMEISFLKFITIKDGEPLHKLSPHLWAIAPFIGFFYGIYMSLSIQATTVIPNVAVTLLIIAAVVGAFDSITGFIIAAGFTFTSLLFGDASGMRTALALASFIIAWFAPGLLSSMYLLAVRIDLGNILPKVSAAAKDFVAILVSSLFGAGMIVVSAILTDSLVVDVQGATFTRWPLFAIVAVTLFAKNYLEVALDSARSKKGVEVVEESLYIARVLSPGFASLLAFAFFGVIYVWTESFLSSLISAALITLPFALLFVVFPEVAGKRIPSLKRNVIIESIVIAATSALVYWGIDFLPLGTADKSKIFILVGVTPVLLHAIYSVLLVSSERFHENEAMESAR